MAINISKVRSGMGPERMLLGEEAYRETAFGGELFQGPAPALSKLSNLLSYFTHNLFQDRGNFFSDQAWCVSGP